MAPRFVTIVDSREVGAAMHRGFSQLAVSLAALTLVACESPATPTPSVTVTASPTPEVQAAAITSPTPSATPKAALLPAEGCEARPGVARRVEDPNGPYAHQVVVAETKDGVTLTGARQVIDHASVPDGVRLADGSLRIYYVNGAEGATWVASLDAKGATPIGPISIDGALRPVGAVDPDATLLPDGKVRLVYLGNLGPPRPGTSEWNICIADSEDGVRFSLVGRAVRFTGAMTTDPSVIRLPDGSWLMAVSQGQRTALARSTDGLRYEPYATVDFGGVPELALMPDGRVRLYTCGRGIQTHLSADAGTTWARESGDIAPALGRRVVCDPSYVPGAGIFVYKTG